MLTRSAFFQDLPDLAGCTNTMLDPASARRRRVDLPFSAEAIEAYLVGIAPLRDAYSVSSHIDAYSEAYALAEFLIDTDMCRRLLTRAQYETTFSFADRILLASRIRSDERKLLEAAFDRERKNFGRELPTVLLVEVAPQLAHRYLLECALRGLIRPRGQTSREAYIRTMEWIKDQKKVDEFIHAVTGESTGADGSECAIALTG